MPKEKERAGKGRGSDDQPNHELKSEARNDLKFNKETH